MTTTTPADLRPRRTGYWVGGALVGVGVLVGLLLLGLAVSHSIGEFRDLGDDVDAMDRIAVPGEGVVAIDDTGEQVIYVEGGGGAAPIATLSPTEVTVESTEPDSTPIPVRRVSASETYDLSGHAGRAALEFTVDDPGDYRIAVEEAPTSVTNVAVGPHLDLIGPIGSVFVAIFVPAGIGGVLVIAGAVVLIVTGVRRSGAQRRARIAAAPPAWGAPPPGYPPPGGVPPYGAGPRPGVPGGVPGGALPPGLPLSAYPPPGWSSSGWPPSAPGAVPEGLPPLPSAGPAWQVASGPPVTDGPPGAADRAGSSGTGALPPIGGGAAPAVAAAGVDERPAAAPDPPGEG